MKIAQGYRYISCTVVALRQLYTHGNYELVCGEHRSVVESESFDKLVSIFFEADYGRRELSFSVNKCSPRDTLLYLDQIQSGMDCICGYDFDEDNPERSSRHKGRKQDKKNEPKVGKTRPIYKIPYKHLLR